MKRVAAVALSAGVAAALTMPTNAAAGPSLSGDTPQLADAQMLAGLERDLGLDASAALERLAADLEASHAEQELRDTLGDSFGGAWIADGELHVGITDLSMAADVVAAGANPTLVPHSEASLESAMSGLDRSATPDAAEVYGWHVDVTTNSVVVSAAPGAEDAAAEWLEDAGVDAATVTVETTTEAPELFYDIRGGDAYYPGNSRCSVGFSVTPRGFVTAGHCGGVGTSVRGYNQAAMGTVQRSNFPGADAGYVATNTNWTPRALVNRYSGNIAVNGSQEASIGAATCRSGSTTGYHCGTITGKNHTVNYPQGTVQGLTRTNVCAEPGDSGGSFIASGINAQGMTSGGSGNCSWGGTTYFQPLIPVLNAYGVSLVTS